MDEGVLRKLAATARACLNPMAAMFGGVVGQEVRCPGSVGRLQQGGGGACWSPPQLPFLLPSGTSACSAPAFPTLSSSQPGAASLRLLPFSRTPTRPLSQNLPHSTSRRLLPPSIPPTRPPPQNHFHFHNPQVVKAASGKFHPLHQWLYFDSLESLPDEPLSAEEVASQVRPVSCSAS